MAVYSKYGRYCSFRTDGIGLAHISRYVYNRNTHTQIYIYMYKGVYIYIHAYMYVCIYIYTHICDRKAVHSHLLILRLS